MDHFERLDGGMGLQVKQNVLCHVMVYCVVLYCHTMCLCRVVPSRTVSRFDSVIKKKKKLPLQNKFIVTCFGSFCK